MKKYLILVLVLFESIVHAGQKAKTVDITKMPDNIVELKEILPNVEYDIRYYSDHNFVGSKIDGYDEPLCLLTKNAAAALVKVEDELGQFGFSLKIYDCYRPQRAVNHFARWAEDIKDTKMKAEFYPHIDKGTLFNDGYIAHKSGHSRGSTVDLTIIPLPAPKQETYKQGDKLRSCVLPAAQRFHDNSLDFGTGFDCFDTLTHTADHRISPNQRLNRLLLKSIMEKYGFVNYRKEWWHFTLKDELYPDTFFDFPVGHIK